MEEKKVIRFSEFQMFWQGGMGLNNHISFGWWKH